MNYLKRYTALFPIAIFKYVYLLLPILIAVVNIYLRNVTIAFCLLTIYLGLDATITFVNLGGILNKNTLHNDYIKSSGRGVKILSTALKIDTCRRFISIAAIVFSSMYESMTFSSTLSILVLIWLVYEYVSYFSYILNAQKFIAVIYVGFLLTALLVSIKLTILKNIPVWPLVVLYYGKHRLVKKNMEEIYYD